LLPNHGVFENFLLIRGLLENENHFAHGGETGQEAQGDPEALGRVLGQFLLGCPGALCGDQLHLDSRKAVGRSALEVGEILFENRHVPHRPIPAHFTR
jgi:hypothetical protein